MRLFLMIAAAAIAMYAMDPALTPVNEAECSIQVMSSSSEVTLQLHRGHEPVRADVKVEWLDEKDGILATGHKQTLIDPKSGRATITLPIGWSRFGEKKRADLLWNRIRYRVVAADGEVVKGIASISALKSNIFRIQIDQPRLSPDSERYKLLVRAVHPITEQPLANVELSARLLSGTAGAADCGKAVSDERGFAAFDVPASPRRIEDARIEVTGNGRGYIHRAELEIEIDPFGKVHVATDRGLYQPGQVLHIRAILLNSRARALADSPVSIRVTDERSATLFATTLRTSRFGIVAADWAIPDNAALGRYRVDVAAIDAPDIGASSATFDISRYELPAFEVRVKSDRRFYLAGQTPVLEVEARYIFGEPVLNGSVQITREAKSCWGANNGSIDTVGERIETSLGPGGKATLTMAVPPACAAVHYLATVTDATSRRSESRPITLQVSDRPIWIEVMRDEALSAALPRTFYVQTHYADGTPAECEVQIREAGKSGSALGSLVRTIRTSKSGLAEVRDFRLSALDGTGEAALHFAATDGSGQTGETKREYDEINSPGITVKTDKALYRRGDPMIARVTSTDPSGTVQVIVTAHGSLLDWFPVRLVNGRAEITIPFKPDFGETVEVQVVRQDASLDELASFSQGVFDTFRVYYPTKSPIRVELQSAERTYRPGADASLKVKVTAADGTPVEAALGLVVIDDASEQRAQSHRPVYYWLRNGSEEFDELDLLDGNSTEAQILAAATLNKGSRERWVFFPYMYETARLGSIYGPAFDKRLSPYRNSWRRCISVGNCPTEDGQFRRFMAASGWNPSGIVDPWDTPLRPVFTVQREQRHLEFISAGPDKRFGTADDQKIFFESWRYFDATAGAIRSALAYATFPQSQAEFDSVLRAARISPARVRDPWGRRYSVSFSAKAVRLSDSMGKVSGGRVVQVPVVMLISAGPDGKAGSDDDFVVATFAAAEQDELSAVAGPAGTRRTLNSRAGIQGRVVDPAGAVVPRATVRATAAGKGAVFEARTDANGEYLLFSIPPGEYVLTAESAEFQLFVARHVVVRVGMIAHVTATLQIASVLEQIEVAGSAPEIQTSMAMIVTPMYKRAPPPPPATGGRVREHFPETLLWLPLLETDRNGTAEVHFRMADSITTWRVSATGSTIDGLIASADDRIQAFQPFFVELDPPSVLTTGDEISLPVVVRNYSDQRQQIRLTMGQEPWFHLSGQPDRIAHVDAGGTAIQAFRLKAVAAIEKGRQEIAARSNQDHDAVRKVIQVHPDGRQITAVRNNLFDKESSINVVIPPDALPGSATTTLRVYPDLLSHIIDSPEEILKKPYGCAEQTISSTFPNLLLLRYAASGGKIDPQLRRRALAYLQKGYDRLLGYRSPSGGFTYFGSGDPDTALTAYALDFLLAAKRYITVDQFPISSAALWLTQQLPRTTGRYRAYILRSMAEYALDSGVVPAGIKDGFQSGRNDPYILSQEVLLALALHEDDAVRSALQKLASLAQNDHDSVSWSSESNTPFRGWGPAGTVETTANAVRAMITAKDAGISVPATAAMIQGGLIYLLRAKDESGLWYSTQATVRVLDVLTMAAQGGGGAVAVELLVNGNPVRIDAKSTDLSRHLVAGANEFRFAKQGGSLAMAQLVTTYYVPWDAHTDAPESLKLQVALSKTNPDIGEAVVARVSARRTSTGSYGMMLAEIGLPPGADVDRSSLEAAIASRTGLWRYEVLPDRVVAYLWPSTGGETQFQFAFRLRYSMRAKAAASTLYDYYNPSARVTLAPQRFTVEAP
ncbi:MG2 domain-containing protein [uncultured Paludibaculum sp.]|uniref:MG2 domain-containing protein n=1 Tax=uncultured Paludibaculum sp. TaxID=1765020 RepID=UPI002AAB857C|nr:MG2 domain-containing protein [uncultured Paludibaculum sp.]